MTKCSRTASSKIYLLGLLVCLYPTITQASIINQRVSVSSTERQCPGLSDPDFVSKYQEGYEAAFFGQTLESAGDQAVDMLCIFNSTVQEINWNYDGTPKRDDTLPTIPAFTPSQVGQRVRFSEIDNKSITQVSGSERLTGQISLDAENLSLPEIKILAESEELERNSFNGYATTEYMWSGEDMTLEFQLNFDFFHSSQEWALDGAPPTKTSDLLLTAIVADEVLFNEDSIFPTEYIGDVIAEQFILSDNEIGETSEDNPYFGNVSVTFDVTAGQTFFLGAQYQGFAKNGGFLNAFNTITGGLNIQGLTQEESLATFNQSLSLVPVQNVSAPATLFLLISSGFILLGKRKRVLTTNTH